MALTHLADTSVLMRISRPDVRTAVREQLAVRSIGRCQLSHLELGFSARNATEWDAITSAVAVFTVIDIDAADLRRAASVQRSLADAGLRGRKVPDLVIAAVAERIGLTVLHYDRDFELIGNLTGQPTQWVVAAGSID